MASLRPSESGTMGPLCFSTSELLKALEEIPTPSFETFRRSSESLKAILASTNNVTVYHTNASLVSLLRICMALFHIKKLSVKQAQNAALVVVDAWDRPQRFDSVL